MFMPAIQPQVYLSVKKFNRCFLPFEPGVCADFGMNEIGRAIKAALTQKRYTQR